LQNTATVGTTEQQTAEMTWTVEKIGEYEDDDKRGGITMACDEEVVVIGKSGWSGEANVYTIETGELKFKLKCNELGDTPAPFSHDNIMVWLGTNIIVTLGLNENTLKIWDKASGTLLAQDLHKDKEKMEEMKRVQKMEPDEKEAWFNEKTAGWDEEKKQIFMYQIAFGYVENDRKFASMTVKDDVVYGGYEGGLLIMGAEGGDWKIIKEVKLDYTVDEIETSGNWLAVAKVEEGQKIFSLWDPEKEEMAENFTGKMKHYSHAKFVYPYLFMVGGRGDSDKTGVEIRHVETGELVRHLLQGEKRYEFVSVSTNGKFFAVCEFVNSFSTGDEKSLKAVVYNVEQVLDTSIEEENLWSYSLEYKLDGLDHVRAVINEKYLIVSHSSTKMDVYSLA